MHSNALKAWRSRCLENNHVVYVKWSYKNKEVDDVRSKISCDDK
jgi:hypothetical protein